MVTENPKLSNAELRSPGLSVLKLSLICKERKEKKNRVVALDNAYSSYEEVLDPLSLMATSEQPFKEVPGEVLSLRRQCARETGEWS